MEESAPPTCVDLAVTIPSLRSELGRSPRSAPAGVSPVAARRTEIVMLDEPTAALGVPQTKQWLALTNAARAEPWRRRHQPQLADVLRSATGSSFFVSAARPGDFSSSK